MNIFIIAGESSGDLHGSYLMKSLKKMNPTISFSGIGGELMEMEGLNSLVNINKMSVMGFIEVIKHLPFFMKVKKNVLEKIKSIQFDHIILIDYPGFNLNLLPKIKNISSAKITYYICPQIWAWKEKRIEILKKYVDNRIVIFPFEHEWYKKRGVDVFFSGHPIFDEWHPMPKVKLAKKLNINPNKPILTLYPGSREQEFKRHFSIFINSAKLIKLQIPDLQVIVGCAKSLNINNFPDKIPEWVILEKLNPQLALEIADIAIIASGTSTLEATVFGTPGVVVYKMSPISWWLSKQFVKVKFAGMVNLIANKEIMSELLQKEANPKNISKYVIKLLSSSKLLNDKQNQLIEIKNQLGDSGANNRIANYILKGENGNI
jgi:lipid-A-disaccharide synthase